MFCAWLYEGFCDFLVFCLVGFDIFFCLEKHEFIVSLNGTAQLIVAYKPIYIKKIKMFLLVHREFHCDISMYIHIVLWFGSPPPLFFFRHSPY
jgi:hypothetical protein